MKTTDSHAGPGYETTTQSPISEPFGISAIPLSLSVLDINNIEERISPNITQYIPSNRHQVRVRLGQDTGWRTLQVPNIPLSELFDDLVPMPIRGPVIRRVMRVSYVEGVEQSHEVGSLEVLVGRLWREEGYGYDSVPHLMFLNN